MNSGGGNAGGAGSTGVMISQKAQLASIYDRLLQLTDRADANAETSAMTVCRAIGPAPPSAPSNGTAASAPESDDVAGKFRLLLNRLEQAIDRQGQQNERLNSFV